MTAFRIGIVGAGFGATSHLPALQNHPRFDVVAIASPRSATEIAQRAKVPLAFRSCEEMLAGCEVDAVTVASPPFAHCDDVLAALGAGKHVIAEKPFATSVAEALRMVEAARGAGTACGVAHEFRFVPQAQALKELIVNGHLGHLRNLEITLLRHTLRRHERRARSWWFERERGGGLAGAVLSHLIDHADWLAGAAPSRALGFARTANPDRIDEEGAFSSNVDDGAFALLEYRDGIAARLAADATAAVESYTCAAHGELRTAVASGPNVIDLTLYAVDRELTDELDCRPAPYQRFAHINENVPLLMELYDEFAKAIEGRPNALPSFDEALATQEVLAAIGYER
ncbi:MAG TPA: Gfo/Idh/MocA family oxidoreductase [Candidatus Cybelea sp.]|jgi:predicted dehydrogenase|nr:Gfo/Idh/MocA family oxidoreductase [Candidatus Cybelea sp.]